MSPIESHQRNAGARIHVGPTATGVPLVLALLLGFALPPPASAATMTWTNPAGGPWATASNWDPPNVPNAAGEGALFPEGGGAFTTTISASYNLDAIRLLNPQTLLDVGAGRTLRTYLPEGVENHGTILLNGGALDGNLHNRSEGRILIPSGCQEAFSDTITNDGSILVNSDGGAGDARLRIDTEGLVLHGAGEVILATAGSPADAQINESYGSLIQGPEHTIRGDGTIYVNFARNDGRIVADVADRMLWMYGAPIALNNGLLLASGNGTLRIESSRITQGATGMVLADGGAVELTTNARIDGGTLHTANGGRMESTTSTSYLSGVTNLGTYGIAGGATVQLLQSCTNHGTILVNSNQSESDARLMISDYNLVLDGTGQIVLQTMGSPADAQVYDNYSSLIQGSEHTIRGEGTIYVDFPRNDGRIVADVADRVLLLQGAPIALNNGLLLGTSDGILRLAGSTITQGTTGMVLADGGAVELTANGRIHGGSLNTANGGRMESTSGTSYLSGVTNLGTYGIIGGATVQLLASCTNHGTILVNANQSETDARLMIEDYGLVLNGTGEIVLQTAGAPLDARVDDSYGNLVQGPEHTIRGEGTISVDIPDNQGTILADVSGRPLNISNSQMNHGTWRADGGLLQLTMGNLTNEGLAEALHGGVFRAERLPTNYDSGVLTGGTWRAGPDGTLRLLNAPITRLAATVILDGPGSAIYRDDAATDALAGLSRIEDSGRFEVAGGREYTLNLPIDNRGELVAGAGGVLRVPGIQTSQGAGTLRADGRLCCTAPLSIEYGSLEGRGTVEAAVRNAAWVRPGPVTGTLAVEGSFEQVPSGAIVIQIAGTGEGEHDRLVVTGEATLDGSLWVEALDSYQPQVGDTFTLMTFGSRIGQFDTLAGCPGPGLCFRPVYTDTSIVITLEVIDPAAVEDDSASPSLPAEVRLASRSQWGGDAVLSLELTEPAHVGLSIFDLTGRRIATLHEGDAAAGYHLYPWDRSSAGGSSPPSGIYLARAQVRTAGGGRRSLTTRVVVVR